MKLHPWAESAIAEVSKAEYRFLADELREYIAYGRVAISATSQLDRVSAADVREAQKAAVADVARHFSGA